MSLVHADNFSIYGTTSSLLTDGIYAEAAGVGSDLSLTTDPDNVSSGYVLKVNGSSGDVFVRKVLPAAVTTQGVAARLYMPALPTNVASLGLFAPSIFFRDGSNATLSYLYVDTVGKLILAGIPGSTTAGATIAQSAGPVVSAGSWFHIEIKIFQSATVGTVEVRVEGAVVINATGLNTSASSIAQVCLGAHAGGSGTGKIAYWKDYVLWNTAGTANNNFLGSVLVTTLVPTSDAALNWTPSSGATGYGILDNIPPVDATYISAGFGPIPAAYKGGLSDLPVTVTSVKGLITTVRAAKSDGGDGSMQVGVISDPAGTPATGLGTDRPITTSQAYWQDIFELDPKTAAAWLPAAVNAAQIQINRTS